MVPPLMFHLGKMSPFYPSDLGSKSTSHFESMSNRVQVLCTSQTPWEWW